MHVRNQKVILISIFLLITIKIFLLLNNIIYPNTIILITSIQLQVIIINMSIQANPTLDTQYIFCQTFL